LLRLTIQVPGLPERVYETTERRVSIGRGSTNLLMVDNPHVSTHHARVELSSRGALFVDMGSTNGSMVQRGSKKIPVAAGGAGIMVEVGDVLVLGDSAAPVTIVVLDDATGGATHPMSDPPSTAISAVPVDPSAGGVIKARRPVASFATLPAVIQERHQAAQAFFDLASVMNGDQLTPVLEAAAAAVFNLCPVLTHLFVEVRDVPEEGEVRTFHWVRGQGEDQGGWRPNRVLVARTGIAREAWLVVHTALERVGGENTAPMSLPSAICVPLLKQDDPLGVLHLDNRASSEAIDEGDLAIVSAIGHLLSIAISDHRVVTTPAPEAEDNAEEQE
jgi:pSer/pThr/pTyr-binding forkhead associated (FHA) protein